MFFRKEGGGGGGHVPPGICTHGYGIKTDSGRVRG